jgi:hypothetical protein
MKDIDQKGYEQKTKVTNQAMRRTDEMKKTAEREDQTDDKMDRPQTSQKTERPLPRLLPPLVIRPSDSDQFIGLTENILDSMAPRAQRGHLSDQEIEDCVEVSAIALCWHLAARGARARRDRFAEELMRETFGLMVGIEAAGIALKNGITVHEALEEMAESIMPAQSEETSNRQHQPAEPQTRGKGQTLGDTTAATTIQRQENAADQNETKARRLPPLVLPPFMSKRCCELTAHLLRSIDARTEPGQTSTISDLEIEERARACHYALCWFLAALNNPTRSDQIALRWEKAAPELVCATTAVGVAENRGITVLQSRDYAVSPKCMKLRLMAGAAPGGWVGTETHGCQDQKKSRMK